MITLAFLAHWQFWIQLLISAGILTSAILNGNVNIYGWVLLMVIQTVFLTYVVITGQWGLVPQNVGMWIIALRNYRKWKKAGTGVRKKDLTPGDDLVD